MNSASLINMAIRVAEVEENTPLVNDLLRVKQNEARRQFLQRLAEDIKQEALDATA